MVGEINKDAEKELNDILEDSIKLFTDFKKLKNLTDKYNTDKSRALGYHGREIFELIQNIDDAYTKYRLENKIKVAKKVEALIQYTGEKLIISNKGTVFDDDSILRLCQGGISNKPKENYIGNKGIGFRSVLNWSSDIRIYSDKYSVRFSKEYADKQMEVLKKEDKFGIIKDQLSENPNITFPIFYAPEPIPSIDLKDFDTVIELIINPETQNDEWNIDKQIDSFKEEILLFLPNITKITFHKKDKVFSYEKIQASESNQFFIKRTPSNDELKGYFLFSNSENETMDKYKILEDKEIKTAKLAFAIPIDFSANNYPFYTFFPIRQSKTPFNAIMHASFSLSDNRDSINSSSVNIQVFKLLLEFYVSEITKYFSNEKYGNMVLKLLTPKDFCTNYTFGHPFENENDRSIVQFYLELCSKYKIFYSCSKQFISVNDNPKIISNTLAGGAYPECFNNKNFPSLIPTIDNSEILFTKTLLKNQNIEYTAEEILENIEKSKTNWFNTSHSDAYWNVLSFCWWVISFSNMDICPEVLKDDRDNFIKNETTCFFSGAIKDVPKWAQYCLLNQEYENIFISICKKRYKNYLESVRTETSDTDKRLIIRYFAKNCSILFRAYDAVSLVSPLNSSIKGNYARSVDFIKWLWKYSNIIQKPKDETPNKENRKNYLIIEHGNFPDSNGNVESSDNLFFGSEYLNPDGEFYFTDANYKKFALPEILSIENANDKIAASDYFEKYFGVLKSPKIIHMEIDKIGKKEREKYEDFLIQEIKNRGHYYVRLNTSNIAIPYISNLNRLLKSLPTEKILKLILTNDDIKAFLMNPQTYDASLESLIDEERKFHKYYNSFYNYIAFIFFTTPWIEINSIKRRPSECLFSDNEILAKHIPCISKNMINQIKEDFDYDTVKEILLKCGVKNKEYELPPKQFYKLLLNLQRDNTTREISKRIYRESVKALGMSIKENDPDRINFIAKGKVFSKTTKQYEFIKDVYFTGSVVLNLLNKKLLDMPLKNGDKKAVERIFGVKPYTEDYSISKEENEFQYSSINEEFIADFNKYKPYAYALRKEELETSSEKEASEVELRKIRNLEIFLVSKISLKIENSNDFIPVTDLYSLIKTKSDSSWYIYVGNIDNFENLDKRRIASLLVQIFEVILNSQKENKLERYAEFYRSSISDRDYLIEEHFGTKTIIRDSKNIINGQTSEKDEIRIYLKKENLYTTEVENLLSDITLIKINDYNGQKAVYTFLNKIQKEPSELAEILGYEDISIRLVNKAACEIEKNKIIDSVECDIYMSLCEEKLYLKRNLLSEKHTFEAFLDNNYPTDSMINSIHFTPEKYYSQLRCTWLKENNYHNATKSVILSELYSNNLINFMNSIKKNINEIHDFINQTNIKNLLYFDIKKVEEEYVQWLKKHNESNHSQSNNRKRTFEDNCTITDDLIGTAYEPGNKKGESNHHNASNGDPSTFGTENNDNDNNNQEQGDAAESFVIKRLRNKEFKQINDYFNITKDSKDIYKVNWVSGAAERLECQNGNDKLGYDIELSYKGKKLYIEVKSSQNKACIFDISGNELTFAKSHPNEYLLIFVGNMKGKQNITVLPKDFINKNDFRFISEKMKVIYTKTK